MRVSIPVSTAALAQSVQAHASAVHRTVGHPWAMAAMLDRAEAEIDALAADADRLKMHIRSLRQAVRLGRVA